MIIEESIDSLVAKFLEEIMSAKNLIFNYKNHKVLFNYCAKAPSATPCNEHNVIVHFQ
jgi:hypothetical protein